VKHSVLFCTIIAGLLIASFSGPSLASADVTGPCNDETATELGEANDLNPFAPGTTAMSALCGEFLGPGTETLVARALPATCGGYAGWGAFRRETDGSWQLVFKLGDGQNDLIAVGSDLEEVVGVIGPHEPRCVDHPTSKSRIWHWDGGSFVAGPWTLHFSRPSGAFLAHWHRSAILCYLSDNPSLKVPPGSIYHNGAMCVANNPRYSQQADLLSNGRVKSCRIRNPRLGCASACACEEGIPELHTGDQIVEGGYTCRVLNRAVECVNTDGKGFVINNKKIRRLS
jgi:hypothetical protein